MGVSHKVGSVGWRWCGRLDQLTLRLLLMSRLQRLQSRHLFTWRPRLSESSLTPSVSQAPSVEAWGEAVHNKNNCVAALDL